MKYSKQLRFYRILKILAFILIIISLISIIFRLFLSLFVINIFTNKNFELQEPISFLLIGSDYRGEDNTNPDLAGARADALMVATLSPNNSRGNVEFDIVSIPRDTISYIPCLSSTEDYYDKINSALNYGLEKNGDIEEGLTCTVESVEFLLNINIDFYVMATFDAVINIVDAIGGIDIDVPYAFCEQKSDGKGRTSDGSACTENAFYFEKGVQTLNGEEALAYSRQRHQSSDYERGLRQQQVITEIVKKILSDVDKYADDFIKVFLDDFYTNVSRNDIFEFINFFTTLYNNISVNLSNSIPVYLDVKTSPYENLQDNISNGVVKTVNATTLPMSEYYDNLDNFEEDAYITRNYLTKEKSGIASNLIKTKDNSDVDSLKPIGIEISSYSIKSTEITTSSNSYFDYNTLYYTSNLLRKAYNTPLLEPEYDYSVVGINEQQEFVSQKEQQTNPYINDYIDNQSEEEYYYG